MTTSRGSERRGGRPRGPAQGYSRERIGRAAVAIADEHGIDAVSMRKVAAELGTGAMSLYRYVENKEELTQLMLEEVFGNPEEWGALPGDWRQAVRDIARGSRAIQLEHPWVPQLMAGLPTLTPSTLAMLELGLPVLDGLGLSIDEMLESLGLLMAWVAGFVQSELAEREVFDSPEAQAEIQQTLSPKVEELIADGRYPYLARIVREAEHRDHDARFERGLALIIAGIEASLPKEDGPAKAG